MVYPTPQYEALAPDFNSVNIVSGPGDQPLSGAANAWRALAAETNRTAASFGRMLRGLLEEWSGPSATRMFQAAAPFYMWLLEFSQQTSHTADQVSLVVRAYLDTRGLMVDPQVIFNNRWLAHQLTTINTLRQYDQAIAALEREYQEYWVQDVEAMRCYDVDVSHALDELPRWTRPPRVAAAAGAVQPASNHVVINLVD